MRPLSWPEVGQWRRALLATTCLAVVGSINPAVAAPSGLSVGSGQISVSNPNAQTTLIQQSTNKAVLNWNSFSIGSTESVIFQQPGASSVALNRVTSTQPSSIFGHLTANGQVWLLNPNGILFGRSAVVNVAGLVATTSNIADSDFLAGNTNFGVGSSNPNAGVVNQGMIQAADGGYVVMSGAYVQNDGAIQARLGKVVLAGATTFAVDFAGDNLLSFAVTGSVTQAPTDANGNPVTALVNNTGSILADGGQVTLTARAAKGILDNVINTTGMIEANTASVVNGTIVLDGGDGGVTVGGGLSAIGLGSGQVGGTVTVLGGAITIGSTATINVSGDAGGGSAFIGGNFHGAGPLPNAWTTAVQQGATIQADAITTGNGGNVAVWADGYTLFNGTISAQGGALSGNGGFVETSGKQGLSIQTGFVNTLAANGQVGNWLLDPLNIVIQTGGSTTPITSDPFSNNPTGTDTLDPTAISGAASNVTLQAKTDITFNSGVTMSNTGVGLTAQAGNNITVAAGALIDTKGGNITLSANDNGGGTASGSGSISIASAGTNIETNVSGGTGGSITLTTNGGTGSINTGSAPIQTASGAVSLSAGSGGITLGNGSGSISTTGSAGTVSLASAGNISITSGVGIQTTGANVTVSANDSSAGTPTGSGSITFNNLGITTTGKSGTTVSMTNGSSTITLLNSDPFTQGFSTGQTIAGSGIPSGTTIASMSGSTITLSNPVTVTASDVFVRAIGGSTSTGGAITLKTNGGSGAINLGTAGLLAAGGAITLNAASVTGSTNGPGISSSGQNASGAASAAGGNVSITTTTGGVTLGGGIITSGGFNSSGVGGNSGSVTISSAGAVDIGGGLSLITSNSGSSLLASVQSISTGAGSPSNTSQTTANGGAISVTGSSITLELGASSNGGTDEVSGSTSGGGNAGSISLNATGGDVVIGSNSTGSVTGLIARGGDSLNGSGGSGANISVTGTAISMGGKLLSRGGDTVNGASGGAGGNITLTATGSDSGHSIRLFGTSDSPTDSNGTTIQADVSSRGGQINQSGGEFTLTGTVNGAGGNITFQGSGGGALQSDVLLQTSTATSLNGGSGVSIGAGGGGSGGTILINGSINATSANVESLRLTAGNGSATVTGGIGATTALSSLVLGTGISDLPSGSNAGAITLQGPVTVGTQINDLRSSGSLTFNGFITTPLLTMPHDNGAASASLAMLGGGLFTGDIKTSNTQAVSLAGNFTFTSSFAGNFGSNGQSPSFTVLGQTRFDSSALNIPVTITSLTGNSPLTFNTGTGNLTISRLTSTSGMRVSLVSGSAATIDQFTTFGPVTFDISGFKGKAFANGNQVLPITTAKLGAIVPPPPPPPPPPLPVAPSVPVLFASPAPAPVTFQATGPLPSGPASDNAPQTVQGTDTGGAMFSQISAQGPTPAASGNSTAGSGPNNGTSGNTTSSDNTTGSGTPSNPSGTSGSTGSNQGGSRGPTGQGASGSPTATASNTPAPPPDASDRALNVIAAPPPVEPVSHALPAPVRVTTTVVPGFVSQVQHPVVPKSGTPGIQQNYSSSGNSGRW